MVNDAATPSLSASTQCAPALTVDTSRPRRRPTSTCLSPRKSLPTTMAQLASAASPRASLRLSSTAQNASPRCTSPTCWSTVASDRRSSLRSPHASPRGNHATQLPTPMPAPIPIELYFRLLKKAHVLDQLLEVSSFLESQQQHLQQLEADRAKTASVQEFVLVELETYKRKFVEAQQFLLELVESMAALNIKEGALQRGIGSQEAADLAQETKEECVMQELQSMMSHQIHQVPGGQAAHGLRSLESSALRAVGKKYVEQLSCVCVEYEKQLVQSEAELSRAMHSAYKDECLAKLKQYEAMQSHHDDEIKQRTTRIEQLKHETNELQDVIDDQRDEIAQLKQANDALHQNLNQQSCSIEKDMAADLAWQFGTELKAELRRRYGLVPGILDARWHAYFPNCALPE